MRGMGGLETEREVAVAAVRAAARACRAVQRRLVSADAVEKADRSPVTVADFASQAIVCSHLASRLPDDAVVGEEDAALLRQESSNALRAAVVEQVRAVLGAGIAEREVLGWIDRGGATAVGRRAWALDPIDGTKGFLRREQYAIALALLVDGEVVLGVLGCPELEHRGCAGALFAAVRGEPARVTSLWDEDDAFEPLSPPRLDAPARARFCESVESGHSDHETSAAIARELGIETEPLRIDSQCKYAVVARGDASIYLRLPTRADYEEKIWDHAAGAILVEAAGGRVTDVDGRPLDFRCGRTLARNRGIVATSGGIHEAVLAAVGRVRGPA